jgi:hypothetical protein
MVSRLPRLPRKPEPAHNLVVPFPNHGETVYMGQVEGLWGTLAIPAMFLGFAILIVGRKIEGKNVFGPWDRDLTGGVEM